MYHTTLNHFVTSWIEKSTSFLATTSLNFRHWGGVGHHLRSSHHQPKEIPLLGALTVLTSSGSSHERVVGFEKRPVNPTQRWIYVVSQMMIGRYPVNGFMGLLGVGDDCTGHMSVCLSLIS